MDDGGWIKRDKNALGNGWGYFINGKLKYKLDETVQISTGISYKNNQVGASGNEVTTTNQGYYNNTKKQLPFELERVDLEGNFSISF